MKKLMRFTFLLILGAIFSTATVYAQQQQMPPQPEALSPEDVTDEDLQLIVNISQAAEGIQQEANTKMKGIVEEGGIDYSRFQEIMMAQQNPQMAGDVEITEDEQKTLEQVQPELMQVNQEAQQKYVNTIKEEGLSVQKFQQIAQAIQTHPEVAERFEKIQAENEDG